MWNSQWSEILNEVINILIEQRKFYKKLGESEIA